ncbi:unnamed protein product [Prorocentrum cordatum]|uniref:Uncharacterized protein n=1 Tax=Prorocentrum cordatum TaxID=2364126 RepID=A0ABN9QTV5_9DINO|nr:unnamed protein product [Polarella glacialis]
MPYETCRDFSVPLKVGDKLEFKIGEATTGTFAVSELPASDSVLLLVVARHDPLSTAVSFESHVFSNMESPQVAIIDAYEGSAKGKAVISDAQVKGGPPARREELRYSSVVSVLAGEYTVELDGAKGPETASKSLVALPHENYVLLRTDGHRIAQRAVVPRGPGCLPELPGQGRPAERRGHRARAGGGPVGRRGGALSARRSRAPPGARRGAEGVRRCAKEETEAPPIAHVCYFNGL